MRFLGIGRRVEVGERSSVTVTIKSAPEMGANCWPVYRPVSGRHSSDVCMCPCDTHAVSGRVPANSYRASHASGGRRANVWTTQTIHISAGRRQVGRTQGGARLASERCLVGARPVPGRYMDCLGCSKFVPAPARCVRCPAGHRTACNNWRHPT